MTSFAGGGGGAIYEDGDPITVTVAPNESVDVPTGHTWDATIVGKCDAAVKVDADIFAESVSKFDADAVLSEGTTVSCGSNGNDNTYAIITGYEL